MIGTSADPHHQRVIPFDQVVNAIGVAQSYDIPHRVLVATESETDPEYLSFLDRLQRFTFYVGRALVKIDANRYPWTPEPGPSACTAVGAPVILWSLGTCARYRWRPTWTAPKTTRCGTPSGCGAPASSAASGAQHDEMLISALG
jgi:hypothetical protein